MMTVRVFPGKGKESLIPAAMVAQMLAGMHGTIRWRNTFWQGNPFFEVSRYDADFQGDLGVYRVVTVPPNDSLQRRHSSFVCVCRRTPRWETGGPIVDIVLAPYKLARDNRTGVETDRVHEVLGGDLSLLYPGAGKGLKDV